jgi:hypothetical protein
LVIQFGRKFVGDKVHERGFVTQFDDRIAVEGSILLGCDGAKSLLKRAMVGGKLPRLEDCGITMLNLSTTYPAETARKLRTLHPILRLVILSFLRIRRPCGSLQSGATNGRE